MTIRSRLFATVTFPLLTISVAVEPALADSLKKPFEVAQEGGISQDGGEQARRNCCARSASEAPNSPRGAGCRGRSAEPR